MRLPIAAALAVILTSCVPRSAEVHGASTPEVPEVTLAASEATLSQGSRSDSAAATMAYSNIRAQDYVGPETCGNCHLKNYKTWQDHPHSRMNQRASDQSVLGDFTGATVEYAGRHALFRRDDSGTYLVDYYHGDRRVRTFRIVRTVGSRYEQDYVAVQIDGPEPEGDILYSEEIRLRFAWSIVAGRWLPQSYLEPTEYPGSEHLADGSLRYDPFIPDRLPFNERCARCHNTYPYDLRFYRILSEYGMLSGFPPFPGVTPRMVYDLAATTGDEDQLGSPRLPMDRFVTDGISCESCHFGGLIHADDSKEQMPRFVPTHPDLAQWTPDHEGARYRSEVVNAICMQCHHSGESAQDNWPDGSAGVNSMESIELERGACASQIKCTDCHDTHVSGPPAGAPDRVEHLAACVECHEEKASIAGAQSHSLHDVEDASCLDCHMPRIVQGFETYNRSHRISMPSESRVLASGMPNACNLCHLDESLAWTRQQLMEGWGARAPLSGGLRPLFGDRLERPAGEAWLEHPQASVRTVVAGAYSRSDLGQAALPNLVNGLADENAYVRMRFMQAVEAVLQRPLSDAEYALTGSPETRQVQVRRLLDQLTATGSL